MSHNRIPVLALLVALGFFACATGDDSLGLGGTGPVAPQSSGSDGGTTLAEAGAPPPTDDAASLPPAADDATVPTSDDSGATPPSDDAAPPPPVDAAPPPPPPVDSGSATCPGYADPSTPAGCTCNPAKHACTPNGCYGGYFCKLSTTSCVPKPC